jgi:hypothetical protein
MLFYAPSQGTVFGMVVDFSSESSFSRFLYSYELAAGGAHTKASDMKNRGIY